MKTISMRSTIKKYLLIILILTLVLSLYYLSKKRKRNLQKEGLYSMNNFINDFKVINGHIEEVKNAKKKSEYALFNDTRHNSS